MKELNPIRASVPPQPSGVSRPPLSEHLRNALLVTVPMAAVAVMFTAPGSGLAEQSHPDSRPHTDQCSAAVVKGNFTKATDSGPGGALLVRSPLFGQQAYLELSLPPGYVHELGGTASKLPSPARSDLVQQALTENIQAALERIHEAHPPPASRTAAKRLLFDCVRVASEVFDSTASDSEVGPSGPRSKSPLHVVPASIAFDKIPLTTPSGKIPPAQAPPSKAPTKIPEPATTPAPPHSDPAKVTHTPAPTPTSPPIVIDEDGTIPNVPSATPSDAAGAKLQL